MGSQLSFMAVLSLIGLTRPIQSTLDRRLRPFGWARLPRAFRTLIAAQIAIQLGMVLPFSSLYFGRFSVAGVFVNLVAIPLISVFVPTALLTGLLHLVPFVGPVLAWLPGCCAELVGRAFFAIAHLGASLFPYPAIPHIPWWVLVPYYALLTQLTGVKRLVAELLYGNGMRLTEALRLRVQDIDFQQRLITVRDGKGAKDRSVVFPERLAPVLVLQLQHAERVHQRDLNAGYGTVNLPYALERKYPNANREFKWQWVFPPYNFSIDPRSGRKQRHHLYQNILQKALAEATRRAGIRKRVGAHALRHYAELGITGTPFLYTPSRRG